MQSFYVTKMLIIDYEIKVMYFYGVVGGRIRKENAL